MKITLVRHGQTEENFQGIMQGRSNHLLNETGRRQCQRLRKKLEDEKYDACYMSPLVRTVETAMILIGDRVEMIPDDRLIERDLGELEGQSRDTYDVKKYWDYKRNCGDLGVEKIQEMFVRVKDFISYIENKYSEDSHILIVSHGSLIRALRHLILGHSLDGNLLDVNIDNCYYEKLDTKK